MAEPILRCSELRKHFGGIVATDAVSIDVAEGEIHAVIGPNGAGKTTLITQLSGEMFSDSGRVQFRGRDVTRMPSHRRSMLGLARSFQITSIFLEMSVLTNVSLAVQAHRGHSFRFWKRTDTDPELVEPAMAALAQVGLADRADSLASALSHGEQRQLEIAMALATEPAMLLLDEPMAGMGREESAGMVETLQELRGKKTMLLIEHDMGLVMGISDHIIVLDHGCVIAQGDAAAIRGTPAVIAAYLGGEEDLT